MELEDALNRFRGPLIGLVLSWGAPPVDAYELAMDSLADAYLNQHDCLADTTDPNVFGRWLRGVAKNKYRNWCRGTSRRERRFRLTTTEELAANIDESTKASVFDPRILQLRREIELLPRKQREVILMHYLEETSVANVAATLSVTPKTVEGRLYQARRRLRERLITAPSSLQLAKAILL
ncbi:RNA polymerase sigma-E factor [Neorhodopirellula pilleata]|uniref:RNA polymerase sigma-E factor n=2 Tax=Neorhodopirellula pilleata TaxID=2714738 RepID=A0A5C6AD63_9BACT|nr:RNA polymerase sigma-E factor [Neorhodopirellula pilleata]